jgi:protein translocase SecG subunit
VQKVYYVLLVLGVLTAITFATLVFLTGKGDAMGGSSGVRTTFKGKAGFDDFVSRATLILGISFMALMLILDIINAQITRHPAA